MNDQTASQQNPNHSEWKEWLRFAQMDYDCAEYLNKMPYYPRPYEIICYHCQQTAEKAVKSLIVYLGSQGGMPKIHSISFLLNQIKDQLKDVNGIIIDKELFDSADYLPHMELFQGIQVRWNSMNLRQKKRYAVRNNSWIG